MTAESATVQAAAQSAGRSALPARRQAPAGADAAWLDRVAHEASRGAGGVPVELLGDYLSLLADAATTGRRPEKAELEAVGQHGRRAAELGVSAGNAVQLYLSAAWRLWRELPAVARFPDSATTSTAAEAVLRAVDRAVASLADGYTAARRDMMRSEETLRRELIEDLLRGDGDVGALVERAEPFGMDMAQPHQVALAAPTGRPAETEVALGALERAVVAGLGDRDVLVATKDGCLVVVAPTIPTGTTRAAADGAAPALRPHAPAAASRADSAPDLGALVHGALRRTPRGGPWRIAVGRAYPGPYGIARSYEEAREALTMTTRLQLNGPVVRAEDMLIYRVLLRDQPAIADLVQAVVSPLSAARGGAGPLLETLDAYFAAGCVVTETARALHLSVRAVTYRLARIAELTGYDPTDPAQRFTVHAAVLGARLLGWPDQEPGSR